MLVESVFYHASCRFIVWRECFKKLKSSFDNHFVLFFFVRNREKNIYKKRDIKQIVEEGRDMEEIHLKWYIKWKQF